VHCRRDRLRQPRLRKGLSGTTPTGPSALLEPGPAWSSRSSGRGPGCRGRRSARRSRPRRARMCRRVAISSRRRPLGPEAGARRRQTDDLDKFRTAVLSLDLPVGSASTLGSEVRRDRQNSNARVQHYMLQWQNGSLFTVWPGGVHHRSRQVDPLGPWDQRSR